MRDLTGTRLGHYDVVEKLGAGGMSVVYRAVQVSLGREVALKVLGAALVEDQEFVKRFEVEARTLATLDHPYILPIYDFETVDDITYLAMPLARGGTLEDLLAPGPMEPVRAWGYMKAVGEGLAHAHEHGVIHRDLKPGNVFLHSDGRPMLGDFGLARVAKGETHLTNAGFTVGTPGYMAPEQVMGREVDQRVDIYAYAAMFLRILTGRLLYTGATAMEINIATVQAPVPSAAELNPNLPFELDVVLAKALAKDPAMRHQNMRELLADFARLPQHRTQTGAPIPTPLTPAPLKPAPAPVSMATAVNTPVPASAVLTVTPPSQAGLASATQTLQLLGLPRLQPKERLLENTFFLNAVISALEVAGRRWPEVATAAGLPQYAQQSPPEGSERTIPAENLAKLCDGFETVFGVEAPEKLRAWGEETHKKSHQGRAGALKLMPGEMRKLDNVMKMFTKGIDEARGEPVTMIREMDPHHFWIAVYSNPYAIGRRRPAKACAPLSGGLDALLRWSGLSHHWVAAEIECGCVTGLEDCVFSVRQEKKVKK